MTTRREALFCAFAAPVMADVPVRSVGGGHIVAEDHTLAKESARGFCKLAMARRPVLILPARRFIALGQAVELRSKASSGTWLIFESASFLLSETERAKQAITLGRVFDLELSDPVWLEGNAWAGEYVHFEWPIQRSLRPFLAVTSIRATRGQVIARWDGQAVAVRQPIGKGGLIFLTTMLGPGLLADEREAVEVGCSLLLA